jgi:uncharacterized protein with ATP-grasp and redox domains
MRSSASLSSLLILTFALITSGCETTDRALTAAERVVKSRTGQTVIDLAGGKDPAQIAKKRLDQYARDPNALVRDLRDAQKDFETSGVSISLSFIHHAMDGQDCDSSRRWC